MHLESIGRHAHTHTQSLIVFLQITTCSAESTAFHATGSKQTVSSQGLVDDRTILLEPATKESTDATRDENNTLSVFLLFFFFFVSPQSLPRAMQVIGPPAACHTWN